MTQEVRIDKWLWAVRLFKTRTLATEQCKKGKIMVNNSVAKASRMVKIGDTVQIKRNPVLFSFKVLELSQNRMNAKLVPEFLQDITTPDQLALLELGKIASNGVRERGTGRPTKKDRRELDQYTTPYYLDEEWDFSVND
ncbi:MAG: RNA-binding S4 domain-containing protein [Paludibacter sp.]|jgi:ribosome-associated heat shock protein Hsp15|nr:RNA-binding S4 domain-containing protein [Paludibacter sp.]